MVRTDLPDIISVMLQVLATSKVIRAHRKGASFGTRWQTPGSLKVPEQYRFGPENQNVFQLPRLLEHSSQPDTTKYPARYRGFREALSMLLDNLALLVFFMSQDSVNAATG